VSKSELSEKLASLYQRRSLQGYVRWKVKTDPLYEAVFDSLRDSDHPLVDVGCGVGLLAFYLRERGYRATIRGVDFDERKIDVATRAASAYEGVAFESGDARNPLPAQHNVALLDILQYFDGASQRRILDNAARSAPHGGLVIIRQALRDRSWRFRLTRAVDASARVFRWMKAEQLDFPTREAIVAAFDGFEAEIRPLWGAMPYNNYLFVFRRH
jgi:SAM-dependent methyltransferase